MKLTNDEIINRYLQHFSHSNASIKTRKSALNYFFKKNHFDYNNPISEISTENLIDYFDFLNSNPSISLTTKKNKWAILKSFLNFISEYYKFNIIIPKYSVSWKKTHKKPNSHSDEILTINEVRKILLYFKKTNFKLYLIFRLFAESGCRKGGVLGLKYPNINVEQRFLETDEKTGNKVYYFSGTMASYLKLYIIERKKIINNNEFLFLNNSLNKYSNRFFNLKLKEALKVLGINKNVSVQNFRSTLNTLRYNKGCPLEICKILIGHKISDITIKHYTKLKISDFLNYFDNYNPFKNIQI